MITDGLAVFFLMHVGEIFVRLADLVFHVPRIIEGSDVEKGVAFIGKPFAVPADDDTVGGGNNGRAIAATDRGHYEPEGVAFGNGFSQSHKWNEESARRARSQRLLWDKTPSVRFGLDLLSGSILRKRIAAMTLNREGAKEDCWI
jgi:hypothetical protein|tara:strand:+ start:18174 stop:18608 length:435 start_codon:yes stop_codon:yes gene_type:complete